jgi:hypothetical protein
MDSVEIPILVQAYLLKPSTDIPLAPIIKPDYSRLTLTRDSIRADIVDHIDPKDNDRAFDPATGTWRKDRMGVYLHWILPQHYRTASAIDANSTIPCVLLGTNKSQTLQTHIRKPKLIGQSQRDGWLFAAIW